MSKSLPFVIEVTKFISFKIKNNPTSSPGPFIILGRRSPNLTRGPWDEVENKTLQFLGLAKFVVKLPAAFYYICFDKETSLRLNESNLKITF